MARIYSLAHRLVTSDLVTMDQSAEVLDFGEELHNRASPKKLAELRERQHPPPQSSPSVSAHPFAWGLTAHLRVGTPEEPAQWQFAGTLLATLVRDHLDDESLTEAQARALVDFITAQLAELVKWSQERGVQVKDCTWAEVEAVLADLGEYGGEDAGSLILAKSQMGLYYFQKFFGDPGRRTLRGQMTESAFAKSDLWISGYNRILVAVYLCLMQQVMRVYETRGAAAR